MEERRGGLSTNHVLVNRNHSLPVRLFSLLLGATLPCSSLLAIAIRKDFPNLFPEIFGYSFDGILHWAGVLFFVLAAVLTVSSGTKYMMKYWSVFIGEDGNKGE